MSLDIDDKSSQETTHSDSKKRSQVVVIPFYLPTEQDKVIILPLVRRKRKYCVNKGN